MPDQAVGGKKNVCPECAKLVERCSTCGLPVKTNYTTLPDGRYLCARDAAESIGTDEEAKQICDQARDEVDRVLSRYLTLPETNVLVSIVNRFYLENLFRSPTAGQACVSVFGATVSNPLPGDRIIHSVSIISHLRKSRLMAVCAHEYTHAWLGQNLSAERRASLDRDTVEAFCELIAYRLMESRGETFEMETIKKNAYTKGQIDVLLAADRERGFYSVMEWMQTGADAKMDTANLGTLRPPADGVASAAILSVPPPPAPDVLVLKGISGGGDRRFALINNVTFAPLESGRVSIGQTNVTIQCLEIRSNSVVIQITGAKAKTELFLRDSR